MDRAPTRPMLISGQAERADDRSGCRADRAERQGPGARHARSRSQPVTDRHPVRRQPAPNDAEYLLGHPRVRARVPTRRTSSYGHEMACRLQGACSLGRECSSSPFGIVGSWPTVRSAPWTVDSVWLVRCPHSRRRSSSTDVPDNVPESHTAARPFPGPRQASRPDVPDNRPLSGGFTDRSLFRETNSS